MAMLHILRELQEEVDFSLKVVHVHHGIRGQEADRDSSFVEKICKEWQIPCSIHYYDVPKLSREWKLGEEETGRIVRKEAFGKEISFYREKWKKENNPGNDTEDRKVKIALAHNQEDLAETMIHNLCRGTGLRGLCTMRPVAGEIIRPVLCLSRGKIARYLEQESIPHIQDSTNLSDEYTRNRIRHHILPMLEQEINAKAVAHMSETAERISQAEEYLTCQSLQILEEFHTDTGYYFTEKFFVQPQIIQTYALQQAMENLAGRRKDISAVHYEKVLALYEMQTGRKISLPYCMEARKDYDGVKLYLLNKEERRKRKTEEWELIVPGKAICPLGTFSAEIFLYEGQKIEEKKYTKWLDYDRIKNSLLIRNRQPGDYFVLDETGRTQKLKQYFVNEKILKEQRDTIPLVADGAHILWIVGYRISAYYKVSSTTKTILEIQYHGGREDNE